MSERTSAPSGAARAAVVYLGPLNCEAAVGLPWRRVRDHARDLGVPLVRFGKALLVPADLLVAALRARAEAVTESETPGPSVDPAAAIRERLGVVRRVG